MFKKILLLLSASLLMLYCLSITAYAKDNQSFNFDYSEIYGEIDVETDKLLDELGIKDTNVSELLDLSPRKIIDLIIELIKGKWKEPFRTVGTVSCICVLSSFINTLNINKIKNETMFSFFETSVVLISVSIPLSAVLASAISSMKLLSDFMLAYIPVFTGVISASGMALSAVSYNAILLSFAEISSKLSTDFIIPAVFMLTLISIYSSTGSSVEVNNITSVIKKIVTVILSLTAGIFTGLLALKSKIAIAADSVAVKGVKLLSGSVIPIVGGAIGDAFSSVLGSFALIKNTVGAFGIIVILLTVLPSVLSLLLWFFSLSISSMICSFTGNNETAKIINSINSCISMVNTVLIFFATVFIISTGIMLNLRG